MKDQNSRLYPCVMSYHGVQCNGIAALVGDRYVCQQCAWEWTKAGVSIHGDRSDYSV